MPRSILLDELSGIGDRMDFYNMHSSVYLPAREPESSIAYDTIEYTTIYLDHVFHPLYDHIKKCKSCCGIVMAVDLMDRNYDRHPERSFFLNCSCGEEWAFPNIFLSIKYKGADFESLIMQINLEIRENTKDRRTFRRFVEIDHRKHDVPLKYRNAITSLEI